MNALKRWNQMKNMEAFQRDLDCLLGGSGRSSADGRQETMAVVEWAPLVDISEDAAEYRIKAELPDVKKEDVKVVAQEGTLTISGVRKFEAEESGRKYHRIERTYGSFRRSFLLPEDANPTKVTAEFKDGLLLVHLVKEAKAAPEQIEVRVS